MKFKPWIMVSVERLESSFGILTPKDHRELAARGLRVAKTWTKPSVAEQLMMLAASYLELAERDEPGTAIPTRRARKSWLLSPC
ncbi:MAG TPA: hypothetical protein VF493_22420 [Terriglobales bacterium]